MGAATLPSQRCSPHPVNGQNTMAAQTLDGSLRGLRHLALCLYIHLTRVSECAYVCVYVWVCVCGARNILYSGGVDSYGPLNGSNNVKELLCHIHQSLLSVRARQKCWHPNTSRWVRRPFRRQLLDTQARSYRRMVTVDCQVVTRGEKGQGVWEAPEEQSTGI